VTPSKPAGPKISIGCTVGENLACIPDRGDAQGLDPYHGLDSNPRPGFVLHSSLSPTGEAEASRTLCIGGLQEQVRQIRMHAEVNLPYRANHSSHGGYSPLCCHSRGTLFHLPVLAKGWGAISSRYGKHASITME
jgi:hypothetical protein